MSQKLRPLRCPVCGTEMTSWEGAEEHFNQHDRENFWAFVYQTAASVATWPEWKRKAAEFVVNGHNRGEKP